MRYGAFFLAGFVLMIVQANLFRVIQLIHVPGLVPSLVLPLVVFMGVREYPLAKGAATAFALGYGTDLLGMSPVGLYTFTYVALYVLARTAGVRLAAQTIWMQLALGFGFAALESITVLVLLAIFGRDPYVPRALYPMAFPHVLATAALSPLIFRFASLIHNRTARGGASGSAAR
ncbi:hypothetical protein BH09MYX1_BH09MYX1_07350 [soil metagenome]